MKTRDKFILLNLVIVIFTIFNFSKTIDIANEVFNYTNDFNFSFFWLYAPFVCLQTPNMLLKILGFLPIIFSLFIIKHNYSYKKNIFIILLLSFTHLVMSVLIVYIMSIIKFGFINVEIEFNLFNTSIRMLIGYYIYMLFWYWFSTGLILTFKNKFISSSIIIIPFLIQFIEINFIRAYRLNYMYIYTPTALSRELVVRQFPYWIVNSWIPENTGFPYANTSLLYPNDQKIGYLWIFGFLIFYLLIANTIPLYYQVKQYRKTHISNKVLRICKDRCHSGKKDINQVADYIEDTLKAKKEMDVNSIPLYNSYIKETHHNIQSCNGINDQVSVYTLSSTLQISLFTQSEIRKIKRLKKRNGVKFRMAPLQILLDFQKGSFLTEGFGSELLAYKLIIFRGLSNEDILDKSYDFYNYIQAIKNNMYI